MIQQYLIEFFVGALAITVFAALLWAFKRLPAERWQFVATVPIRKNEDGHWEGLNITYYGAFSAMSYVLSIALLMIMLSALSIPLWAQIGFIATMLAIIVPSSRWVAKLVEGKSHTFTVCGAVFVAVIVCPPAVMALSEAMVVLGQSKIAAMPVLAAIAIAYAFGEGVGRVACISFGCCYGKPVASTHGIARAIFAKLNFVFHGTTKKIAYEAQLDGVPVVPIQALTSTIYILAGLASFWLFMRGWFASAAVISMGLTQVWRVYSETLRADYRGDAATSPYQWMALATAVISVGYAVALHDSPGVMPSLEKGLAAVWSPGALVSLQIIGLLIFFYTGRSEVTQARMSIHVCHDKT